MTELREKIRSLLADNQTEAAIDTLMQWAQNNYGELYDECVLLRSRWEKIEEDSALGLISHEETMRQTNQVNAGLLTLMGGLEPVPKTASVAPTRGKQRRLYLALAAMFAAVALLTGYALGWFRPDTNAQTAVETTTAGSTVQLPDGNSVKLIQNSDEVGYQILEARIEKLSPSKNRLNIRLLCSPVLAYRRPINFWTSSFRFVPADGSPAQAPSNDLNLLAESHASTEGEIQFVLPSGVKGGALKLKYIDTEESLNLKW